MVRKVRGASPAPARIYLMCACTANGTDRGFRHEYRDGCDRSPQVVADIDGNMVEPDMVWLFGERISRGEHEYQTALLAWLRKRKPTDVRCCTDRPVDMNKVDFIEG